MKAMLDSDTCIYLMNKAADIKPTVSFESCFISTIVLGELEFGVANSAEERREQNELALLDFISCFNVVPVSEEVSNIYGALRVELKHNPIGPNDLWIASHALSLDITLISNNIREFSRVKGLAVETWITSPS